MMTGKASKKINRAEVVNQNFIDFVQHYKPQPPKNDWRLMA